MKVIKPPHPIEGQYTKDNMTIFLAGSIEMGKAEDWQKKLELTFAGHEDIVLFNPRRDEWDSSWEQDINNPQFYEQVTWELDALEKADHIIMYFAPGTQSPVSLLELGIHKDSSIVVCCPKGFWRKGNVDIMCRRYSIPVFEDLDSIIEVVHNLYETR